MRKGANLIKVMAGGGGSSKLNNITHSQFLPEKVTAITRIVASFDTYVIAHAYSTWAIRYTVDCGALGIEHRNSMDKETAEYMKSKTVYEGYLTPTLVINNSFSIPPFDQFVLPNQKLLHYKLATSLAGHDLSVHDSVDITDCY
jgi:imidazolonepropionase-like amidohydrolase